jgi:hypothetical protein
MFSLGKENQYGQRNLTLAKRFILKTTKTLCVLQETINHKSFYCMFSLGKENQYGQRNLTLAKSFILKTTKTLCVSNEGTSTISNVFTPIMGNFKAKQNY